MLAAALLVTTLLSQYDSAQRICRDRPVRTRVCAASSPDVPANAVFADGHSILAGLVAWTDNRPPAVIQARTGFSTPLTYAIGGSTVSDCATRYTNYATRYSTLVWHCAVNNLIALTPALTVMLASEPTWDSAVTAGQYVVINYELPAGSLGTTVSAAISDYNTFTGGWCEVNSARGRCVDTYTPELDPDGGLLLAYADGGTFATTDYFHPNDAGTYLIGKLDSDAIIAGPPGAETGTTWAVVAPTSGSGMTTACANSAVTTEDGGTLTTTRAGTAYCSKQGSWKTTGISTSDMVLISANTPRVEPGYDGGLSLLCENAATSLTTQGTDVGSGADWTEINTAAPGAVTVTDNAAVAPDGTTTATRLQMGATPGATDYALTFNLNGCTSGGSAPQTQGIYVKGVSGSGTTDLCVNDIGISSQCVPCTYNSTTYTRCYQANKIFSAAPGSQVFIFGNAPFYNGGTARSANDVYVWGADCITSTTLQSFVNGTRNAETKAVTFTTVNNKFSVVATVDFPAILDTNAAGYQIFWDANNDVRGATSADVGGGVQPHKSLIKIGGSTTTLATTGSSLVAGVGNKISSFFGVSVHGVCVNAGTVYLSAGCQAAVSNLTLATGAATGYVGSLSTGASSVNGWVRGVTISSKMGAR